MAHPDHIKKLLINHNRRLQALEQQKALYGIDTPPQILLEIEDIESQLLQLEEMIEAAAANRPRRILHNLPQPPHTYFVGRQQELKLLRNLLRPYPISQYSVIAITGVGGLGKTALALELAHEYLEKFKDDPFDEECFQAIIWTSSKRKILTDEGIIPRHQITDTLNDIYSTIAAVLERDDITTAQPDKQAERVQHALVQQRTLLIVDNFETIADIRVISFLRELPAPTKAVVTSRRKLYAAFPVELPRLPLSEGLELIKNENKAKGIILAEKEANWLYTQTGGVPLAIVWSISQIAHGHQIQTVLCRLQEARGDIAHFCFKEVVGSIRLNYPNAYRLLLALSIFADDASRDALGYVVGLNAPSIRDDGLVLLESLSLISIKEDSRIEMLALTKAYALQELRNNFELELELRLKLVDYMNNLLISVDRQGIDVYQRLEIEHKNISETIQWCWEKGFIADFLKFADRFTSFLWVRGYWAQNQEMLKKAIEVADLEQLPKPKARLNMHLAYVLSLAGELDQAEHVCQQAIAILRDFDDDADSYAGALSVLGYVYIQKEQLDDAEVELLRGLDVVGRAHDKSLKARLLRNLGQVYSLREDYEKAMSYFEQALGIFERYRIRTDQLSYTYRLVAITAKKQGEIDLARKLLHESLAIAREKQVKLDIVRGTGELAKLEAEARNFELALQLAKQAKLGYLRLRDFKSYSEIDALINQIEAGFSGQAGLAHVADHY